MSNEVRANGISVGGNILGGGQSTSNSIPPLCSQQILFSFAGPELHGSCDFRKKRRKGEIKVLVLQMPKGIRGEKTRGK